MNENARAVLGAEPCADGTLTRERTCPACSQEASVTLGYGDVCGALLKAGESPVMSEMTIA